MSVIPTEIVETENVHGIAQRMLDLVEEARRSLDLRDDATRGIRTELARRHVVRLEAAVQLFAAAAEALPEATGSVEVPTVYARCGSCGHVGVYHSARHGVVRCKYCRAHAPGEPATFEELAAIADRLAPRSGRVAASRVS